MDVRVTASGSGRRMRTVSGKVLFLDFDGVLHPTLSQGRDLFSRADALAVVVGHWKPAVVISSSWRFHDRFEDVVGRLPQAIAAQVVGATGPAMMGRHARWNEIRACCARNGYRDWRALDDSAFEFPTPCAELIRCDGAIGLTQRELDALVGWLGA
jgi:hypothetical protein